MRQIHSEDVLAFLGRSLLASIFLAAGMSKLRQPETTEQYMKAKKLPMPHVLRPAAAGFELAAALSLVLGVRSRVGALAAFGYLIPTTLIFHDFWNAEGPEREMQLINFLKNLAIMGALVRTVEHGSGQLALRRPVEPAPLKEELIQEFGFRRRAA